MSLNNLNDSHNNKSKMFNTSIIKSDLIELRNSIEEIERKFEDKLEMLDKKQENFKKIDDKVNQFLEEIDSNIRLNIGGKIFITKTSTLLYFKNSVFYKLLSDKIEKKEPLYKELFFDRSYKMFQYILDYMRTKQFYYDGINKFDIEDLKIECEYYGIDEILEELENRTREIIFVNFVSSPRYSSAGTHNLEDLTDRSLQKGICVQSPYEIIIELNFEHYITSMEIGGWNGNTGIWYPGNGANATVSTSIDNSEWKTVGSLPSNYSSLIQKVTLTPSTGRFIKFKHSSYLGIGFLKLYSD